MDWDKLLKVKDGQKLILEIGANIKPMAKHTYPDDKVLILDVDENLKPDILADASDMPPELYGKFDVLLASHVLEHFSYWKTEEVLRGWIKCLKPNGELHIIVPSWEWGCREVLSENPSPAVYGHFFAGQMTQWDNHLTMFTMRKLRQLFDKCGVNTQYANTGIYIIKTPVGELQAEQHYVAGTIGEPKLERKRPQV